LSSSISSSSSLSLVAPSLLGDNFPLRCRGGGERESDDTEEDDDDDDEVPELVLESESELEPEVELELELERDPGVVFCSLLFPSTFPFALALAGTNMTLLSIFVFRLLPLWFFLLSPSSDPESSAKTP
jgi:hypothetical protein